jgi:hypothetical protein
MEGNEMYVIITDSNAILNLARSKGAQIIKIESPRDVLTNKITDTTSLIHDYLVGYLGFTPYGLAYNDLKIIIEKSIKTPNSEAKSIMYEIFPYCSSINGSSVAAIDHRIALEAKKAFEKRTYTRFNEIFGEIQQVPSNKPFIRSVVSFFKENFM